jgi:hypothetical protein
MILTEYAEFDGFALAGLIAKRQHQRRGSLSDGDKGL